MKRLAVFVEGQTEQIFVRKLIEEIGGKRQIKFELKSLGGRSPSAIVGMQEAIGMAKPTTETHFVLIYDCQQDEKVKSVILERHRNLEQAGYLAILGLRDLHPSSLADINLVKQGLRTRIPTKGIPIHILLAVSEIEAWFIRDHTHFERIDPLLSGDHIHATFGFDPRVGAVETLANPADFLHNTYALAGKAYRKRRRQVSRTVDALDYALLYVEGVQDTPHLRELIGHIDSFVIA